MVGGLGFRESKAYRLIGFRRFGFKVWGLGFWEVWEVWEVKGLGFRRFRV